jgi:hypothetical protein
VTVAVTDAEAADGPAVIAVEVIVVEAATAEEAENADRGSKTSSPCGDLEPRKGFLIAANPLL